MSAADQATTAPLVVVIVLYGETPEGSAAFRSLDGELARLPSLAGQLTCLLYDNSPSAGTLPSTAFRCLYQHHPANPGLAVHYQHALRYALERGIPWLVLLDQDTTITEPYLREIAATTSARLGDAETVALAPRLVQQGDILSPHWPTFSFPSSPLPGVTGLQTREVAVFNSGCVLRSTAVQRIGGFPQQFSLDYLDHAVFRQLQHAGGRVYLLNACLEHHLGSKNADLANEFRTSARIRSIALAQSRFYARYGTAWERFLLFLQRAKRACKLLGRGHPRAALTLLQYTLFPEN